MNGALLRKELRELMPWGILMGALAVSEIAMRLIEQTDMLPLGRTFRMLNSETIVFYWFIAFAIGTGLAIREHDDGTVRFLDGLPVSRTRVFLVKCAVMFALVLVAPIVRVAAILLLHALSRESLSGEWHPLLIAQAFALQVLLIANGLLIGAALGRLRSLTWLALGVVAAALLVTVDRVPLTASLNPLSLLDWQWSTAGLRVDADAVLIQAIIAAAAFLIAWDGFVRGGRPRAMRLVAQPFVGATVAAATVAAGVVVLLLAKPSSGPSPGTVGPSGGAGSFEFAESPPAQTTVAHYRFSYPAHESQAALALAEEADAIFGRVHELLGVPLGEAIDVDASGAMRNTHGTAFFGRIRMTLSSEVRVVLAHETAHVVAHRLAGGATAAQWGGAAVLSEGLASWVDAHFRATSWQRDDRMLTLAALHARRELLVEELASPSVLESRRDEGLKYSAGEALIRAIVRLYGEAALLRLLEAFAAPSLPSDAMGLPLWRATFQLARMDLPAVIDEFYREVSVYAQEHEERIAALPRPRAVLIRQGNAYGVITLVDEPSEEHAAYEYVLRFRPALDSPLATLSSIDTVANRIHWLTLDRVAFGRACMQPGVRIGSETLLEPWTCVPLSDASEPTVVQPTN